MPSQPGAVAAARRSLDQRQFDRCITLHEQFLRRGGGSRLRLQFADIQELDCRSRLLNDADFTAADLQDAVLTGSHFERASFHCANLRGCDLRESNLKRVDLRGACLAGASLSGAVMDEADMRAAYIAHAGDDGVARFDRHGLHGNSGGAGADFTNCAMRGVRLCSANLKGANFTGAVLDGSDLRGARLADAIFQDTVLTSVALDEGGGLNPMQLAGCLLAPSEAVVARGPMLRERLREAGEWVESGGERGAPANLDYEDLRPLGAGLRGRLLTALSAQGVCAVYTDFSGSQLQGACFDNADLRGAVFDRADLRGASFRNAKLSHARFNGADLMPLALPSGQALDPRFDGASLDRADFSNAVRAAA